MGQGQRAASRAIGKSENFLGRVEFGRQRIDVIEFLDLADELGLDPQMTIEQIAEAARGKARRH